MTAIMTALLFFTKDILKTACLILIGRDVFVFPQKTRSRLFFLLPVLQAGAAALAVAPLPLAEENQRMLADTCSFLLCVFLPVTLTPAPRRSLRSFLCAALLLDFTADALYSLVSGIASDALWWESSFGAVFFLLVLLFLRSTGRRGETGFLRGAFIHIPKWTWAVLLFFEFTCYYRAFGEALAWYNVFAGVSVIAVLLTLFFLVWKILVSARQQNELLQQMAAQKAYGERLQRSDEELRAFRHDYKNHLIVVRSYLENGDLEAAKNYFDSVNALSPEALRQVSTGNFAADALLSYKLKAAEESGVHFRFEGRIPPDGMRNEDLCTILSNLLDNAVEAAAPASGEKDIHIEAVSKNGFLLLCVTNPTAEGRSDKNAPSDLPATTKEDKKNHGYGLRNVRRTVRKYGGSFTTETDDSTFTANVRIRIQEPV